MAFTTLYSVHRYAVELFFLIYFIKTALLLFNRETWLEKFSKFLKIPEMAISTVFLGTGIYLLTEVPELKGFHVAKILVLLASIPLAVVAFKKKNKIMALLSLFLLTMVYLLAVMAKNSTPQIPSEILDGKQLYEQLCASCHGFDGKKAAMGSKDLTVLETGEEEIISMIETGKNAMPGFKSTLTSDQAKAIAEHVMGLRNVGKK